MRPRPRRIRLPISFPAAGTVPFRCFLQRHNVLQRVSQPIRSAKRSSQPDWEQASGRVSAPDLAQTDMIT